MENKINIEIDALPIKKEEANFESREALNSITKFVQSQMGSVQSFETNVIKENFLETYSELIEVLESAESVSKKFKLDSVSFTLTVDISGKVSLLSTVSGSSSQKTGITINLKPRNEE